MSVKKNKDEKGLPHFDNLSKTVLYNNGYLLPRTMLITKVVFEFSWERISVNRNFLRVSTIPGPDRATFVWPVSSPVIDDNHNQLSDQL